MTPLVVSPVLPSQAGVAVPETPLAIALEFPDALVQVDASGCTSISNLQVEDTERLLDWLENHGVTGCECSPQSNGYLTVRWTDSKLVKPVEKI
jgi:hypothetical protein